MWLRLIHQYWRVCVFKDTPANTPYSSFLLVFVAALFFLCVLLQWFFFNSMSQVNFNDILIIGLILVTSYVFYTILLLFLFHKSARMVQTLTCLLACHTIVHAVALPLLWMMSLLNVSNSPGLLSFVLGVFYLVLSLLLSVWQFMITAHIYKHALMIKTFAAFLASLGLLGANLLMVSFW